MARTSRSQGVDEVTWCGSSRQEPGDRNERCLLVCSLALSFASLCLQFGFSYIAQNHLPMDGVAHSGLDAPTPTIEQDSFSQTCSQANLA